jgi:plastocyanin
MKNSKLLGKKLLAGLLFLFTIILLNDCSKSTNNMTPSGSGGPGENEVFIEGMAFNPSTIAVTAGTTITWTNKDAVAHTVTSNTNMFDSGSISTNGTFKFTFATAGTYSYYCKIHPNMVGSVTVN